MGTLRYTGAVAVSASAGARALNLGGAVVTFPRSAPIISEVYEAKEAQLPYCGVHADMKLAAKLINYETR